MIFRYNERMPTANAKRKRSNMKKTILATIALCMLSACAIPIPSGDMKPTTQAYLAIASNKQLERNISVGSVIVGDEAKLHGAITPEAYKDALDTALLTSDYLARVGDTPRYLLDARLIKMEHPYVGFNLDCYATATYTLRSRTTGRVIANDTVKSHYLAKFGEAFDGAARTRICVAKAIRENITHYLRLVATKTKHELK